MRPIERVLKAIDLQLATLDAIETELSERLPAWRDRTIRFLSKDIAREELQILARINAPTWPQDKQMYRDFLVELRKGIETAPDLYIDALDEDTSMEEDSAIAHDAPRTALKQLPKGTRVFVVHGHDSLAKVEVTRTIERLGLDAIVLHEQPNEGRTVIEKFEEHATGVAFAVVILSPDDMGYPAGKEQEQRPRARQNVILELGYFCGILGRRKVSVLYSGDVEIPSDYLGVVYTKLDESGAWRFAIAKEMRAAGLDVDLNRLV